MEILLWLVPPVVVTVLAMAWVGWLGREGRGVIDQDEAARRVGVALERDRRPTRSSGAGPRAGSTGVVVRPARRRPRPQPQTPTQTQPAEVPTLAPLPAPATTTQVAPVAPVAAPTPPVHPGQPDTGEPARRAS